MISSYLEELDSRLRQFFPKVSQESLSGDRIVYQTHLSFEMLSLNYPNIEEMIQHQWRRLYEGAVRKVTDLIMGKTDHFVVRYLPIISKDLIGNIELEVTYEIMCVQNRDVVIPIFTYSETSHSVIEWRCGHCASPNEIKERHCTQCGAPRALLIQEMDR